MSKPYKEARTDLINEAMRLATEYGHLPQFGLLRIRASAYFDAESERRKRRQERKRARDDGSEERGVRAISVSKVS